MSKIREYHRPKEIEDALRLLTRERTKTRLLAGGTCLIGELDETIEALVDLQDLGLDQFEIRSGQATIGAMTRIQELVDSPVLPELLCEMARREGPNTFRNAGTLGGVISLADWESELYGTLLVYQAEVTIETGDGKRQLPLANFNIDQFENGLITSVSFQTDGKTGSARVARTPADKPIVAVIGRRKSNGEMIFAACGVASTPVVIDPEGLDLLEPPTDFRGSSAYRCQMVDVLTRRVVAQLGG